MVKEYKKTKRRKFSDQFKARVALEALRGDRTIEEIAAKHGIYLLPAGVCQQTPRGDPGARSHLGGERQA